MERRRSLFFCMATLLLAGCSDPEAAARERVMKTGIGPLRKDSGRLNRDYFGAPGKEFVALKQPLWPKTFSALQPLRVTLYRDGAALALGGDAGSTEWGVFVVPDGLIYTPPATKTIRYRAIKEGVFIYRNVP